MGDEPTPPAMPQILVVDDEAIVRDLLKRYFSTLNFQVIVAQSGEQCLDIIDTNKPDLVLIDLQMPGMGGLKTIPLIREQYQDLPIIVLTAVNDEATAREALKLGATDYVTKPVDLGTLKKALTTHLLFAA